MNYPLISEYVEAIRNPEENFEELTNLCPVLDEDGNPIMSSGNFAVVFKMKDKNTEKLYAVKCFLKDQEGREESYRLIEEELEFVSSPYLTSIRYLEEELFVDSSSAEEEVFPVLLMDWVDGVTLDKYICTHIVYAYDLAMLAYRFSILATWLLSQPFAHGDLKCDNILVKEDRTLTLVDYDGMFVPAMSGKHARELGSPNFRHPSRTEKEFSNHIDDFPLISILLSLKVISLHPNLWKEYGGSERLLFSEEDYRDISKCKLIQAFFPSNDLELNVLVSLFVLTLGKNDLLGESIKWININRPSITDQTADYKNLKYSYYEQKGWKIKDIEPFTLYDISEVIKAEVVSSIYGKRVCLFLQDNKKKYIPLINFCTLSVGESVDLYRAKVVSFSRKSDTIYRVEI